ncbi:MAG TPA: hypothetical protein VGX28_16265 [Frankiaceae bacterium]|jgi:hypothetical protein|nr:hypothetical protein [Frankiaceae bacterium]
MSHLSRAVRLARRYPKSSAALALVVVLAGVFGGDDEEPSVRPLATLPSPTAAPAHEEAPPTTPPRTATTAPARPSPTATRPPSPTAVPTTRPAATRPPRATHAPSPRQVVSTRRPPAAPALACSASMSDATPKQYSTTTVVVRTASGAGVSATAHYSTKDTTNTGTADSSGTARVPFRISSAKKGYRVVVDVVVSKSGRTASCSTSFVPS